MPLIGLADFCGIIDTSLMATSDKKGVGALTSVTNAQILNLLMCLVNAWINITGNFLVNPGVF